LASSTEPARQRYIAELDELRLQVEVMFVRVDENLERMRQVLETGDVALADVAIAADDEIVAMNLSLTERCYDVLAREGPVASDLRLVVSVIRILNELERVGDLALRVVKLAPDMELLRASPRTYDILLVLADETIEWYRMAMRAWASENLALAVEVANGSPRVEVCFEQFMAGLLTIDGPDAVGVAVKTFYGGRALERIADHAAIIGARLRYLITGEPRHLAAEVR
jgi:phosphate transport system protein